MIPQATIEPVHPSARRIGRPATGTNTVAASERLLAASITEFVEKGFSQASLTRIAERAGVSGPAVCKHFDGKPELLIHAARGSLDESLRTIESTNSPHDLERHWLADDCAAPRRPLLELHVAAGREIELQELLTAWIFEQATLWKYTSEDSVDQIKVFSRLLLGLAQVDSLSSLRSAPDAVAALVDQMVDALFPRTDIPN